MSSTGHYAPFHRADFRQTEQRDFRRPHAQSQRESLAWLERLSLLFDTAFIIPGTNIRFGIEAIMRLVPGIGDLAASALSSFLLYQAYRLGVPRRLLLRMLGNVAVEGIIGSVPFLGDAFDVAFRANRRNVRILREHFERTGRI